MRQIWVGCILLSTAVSGFAVTLGKHIGAAVIGRPLDVRVQMFLAPGEDIEGLCIGSDVFYGDSQVPANQVRNTPQKTAIDTEGFVRVQSLQAVNEPIVTVYMRASCSTPSTRRFVLLADPITEPSVQTAPSPNGPVTESRWVQGSRAALERQLPVSTASAAASVALPQSSAEPAVAARATAPPVAHALATKPLEAVRPAQLAVRPERVVSLAKPKAPNGTRRPAESSPESTARLQLEPLDLGQTIEVDPVLKMSISLLSEPSASDETRAAAALLWTAITASPEEILQDAQKRSVLEAESKKLRDVVAQSQAAVTELRSNLETAQAEKYRNGLVYLLGGALFFAVLALWMLWRRRDSVAQDPEAKIWWASEINSKPEAVLRKAAPATVEVKSEQVSDRVPPLASEQSTDKIFREALRVPDTTFPFGDSTEVPMLSDKDKRDFVLSSTMGASRSVATEELFDVQQKADFFISLGKDAEAIQVLLSHLNESQEPCALTYLDLLNIYHRLDRNAEYERLRKEFNQVFNAGVPPFEQYSDASQGLEAYETALTRIQALWPQPRVLDVIEQSIFRDPQALTKEVFDLEAYRELLLLHAIANDIIKRDDERFGAKTDFQHTTVQPLKVRPKFKAHPKAKRSFGAAARSSQEPLGPDAVFPVSPRLGLDIDLNELFEKTSSTTSLPEDRAPALPSAHAHLDKLPRAVRSAPLSEPNTFEVFDFILEEQDLPSRNVSDKNPSV